MSKNCVKSFKNSRIQSKYTYNRSKTAEIRRDNEPPTAVNNKKVATFGPGKCFGELALMY